MKQKDYDAFIKAVDVVCINCVGISEETCENCPVRKTVDYFSRNKDSLDMEFYGIFIMSNRRGILGWTLMRYDGFCYWYPTHKWYSSYKVARKMADRKNLEIKKRRLNESMISAAL